MAKTTTVSVSALSSLLSSLGQAPATIASTISGLFTSTVNTQATALLHTIAENASRPIVVAKAAEELAMVNNLPNSVEDIIPGFTATGVTPAQIVQLVVQAEAALKA